MTLRQMVAEMMRADRIWGVGEWVYCQHERAFHHKDYRCPKPLNDGSVIDWRRINREQAEQGLPDDLQEMADLFGHAHCAKCDEEGSP